VNIETPPIDAIIPIGRSGLVFIIKLIQQTVPGNGARNVCWYKLNAHKLYVSAQINLLYCSTSPR
jgi:hypothetical protein